MSREDILLKEYEVAQTAVGTLSQQYWIGVGVFIAVNSAILAGLSVGVLQAPRELDLGQVVFAGVWALVISIAMIVVLRSLVVWQRRTTSTMRAIYVRMREIEAELGMARGLLIHGLDHYVKMREIVARSGMRSVPEDDLRLGEWALSSDDRDVLLRYHPKAWWCGFLERKKYAPPRGYSAVRTMLVAFIVVWTLVAGGAVFLVSFNALYDSRVVSYNWAVGWGVVTVAVLPCVLLLGRLLRWLLGPCRTERFVARVSRNLRYVLPWEFDE